MVFDCQVPHTKSSNIFALLSRWRIVVHGGVDGFSRIPVFLHASSNNRAATVLNLFTEAVATFGLPSRVCCDKGGENYDVGFYMLNHPQRGPGRGSIIAGNFLLLPVVIICKVVFKYYYIMF